MNNWLDRLIGFVAPTTALRRLAARQLLERGYDAAKKGRWTNNWLAQNRSADLEMLGDADVVRARARDLVRNNAHAQGILRALLRNVIGCGIKPQSRIRFANGGERDRMNDAIESLWDKWQAVAEVTGRLSFYELQRLCYSEVKEAGECLVRFVTSPDRTRPLPLALEMIEADRLATDEHFFRGRDRFNGNEVRRGVEIDANGVPVAYHIYRQVPNDVHNFDFVPAADSGRANPAPLSAKADRADTGHHGLHADRAVDSRYRPIHDHRDEGGADRVVFLRGDQNRSGRSGRRNCWTHAG